MDEGQTILKEQYKKLPANLKKFVSGRWWSNEISGITRRFGVGNNSQVAIENEVLLVLIGLEPYTDLSENIRREAAVDKTEADSIAEDIVKNVLVKVPEETRNMSRTPEKFRNTKLEEAKKIAEEQRKKVEEIKRRAEENLKKLKNGKESSVEVVEENIEKGEKQAAEEAKNEALNKSKEPIVTEKKDNQPPVLVTKVPGSLEPLRSMERDSQKLSQGTFGNKGGFIPVDNHGVNPMENHGEGVSETSEDIISVIENPEKVKIPEIIVASPDFPSGNRGSSILHPPTGGQNRDSKQTVAMEKEGSNKQPVASSQEDVKKKEEIVDMHMKEVASSPDFAPPSHEATAGHSKATTGKQQPVASPDSLSENRGSEEKTEEGGEHATAPAPVNLPTEVVVSPSSPSGNRGSSTLINQNRDSQENVGKEEEIKSNQPQTLEYPHGRDPYRETIE